MSERKDNRLSVKTLVIIGIIYVASMYIWNEFIIDSTSFQATKNEAGVPSGSITIDDKNKLVIRQEEENNRYRAIAVSKGWFGWSITDDMYLRCDGINEISNESHQKLSFKRNEQFDVVLVTICDPSRIIDYPVVTNQNGTTLEFERTSKIDFKLYFAATKKQIDSITVDYYDKNKNFLFTN